MKKYTVLIMLVLCLGLFQVAFGQGPNFGVGGVLGFPTGDWADYVGGVAFGATGQVMFPMGENMAVGGQVGYIIYGSGDQQVGGYKIEWDANAIPILGVGKYYLGVPGGPRPFVGALAGFHIFSIDVTQEVPTFNPLTGQFTTTTVKSDGGDTEFSIAPMAGVEIGQLEMAAFYMIISDLNYFGARIGFNFGAVE